MSNTEKRFTTIMIVLFLLGIIALSFQIIRTNDIDTVPILGLPHPMHMLLFNLIWPFFGSVLFALMTPRIFAPLYLKLKGLFMPNYKNGQVEIDSEPYNLRKWFTRSLYVGLLVLGIQAALFSFFPFEAFLTANDLAGYEGANIDIRFTLGVTTAIVGLITPIAVGTLSIGWSLEDAGLVHYDIPENTNRIYEIEPVFRRYTSYVKGYAGLSSVLFLFGMVVYFIDVAATHPERVIDAVITMILPLIAVLSTTLGYLTYVKTNTKFLRGKYPNIGTITEEEILS